MAARRSKKSPLVTEADLRIARGSSPLSPPAFDLLPLDVVCIRLSQEHEHGGKIFKPGETITTIRFYADIIANLGKGRIL